MFFLASAKTSRVFLVQWGRQGNSLIRVFARLMSVCRERGGWVSLEVVWRDKQGLRVDDVVVVEEEEEKSDIAALRE